MFIGNFIKPIDDSRQAGTHNVICLLGKTQVTIMMAL